MEKVPNTASRRDFVKTSLSGLAAITILPSKVIAGLGYPAPTDKLNVAVIGVGGVGFRNLTNLKSENIVALCDVDGDYGEKAFRRWSGAKSYKDFRVMFDTQNDIDAVVIATPDHTHSVAAMLAIEAQKHVFVQAPMAHAVFELHRMLQSAKSYNVVTQVGNQVASADEVRDICEIIWSGAIGEIRDVHVWTNQPQWPQGLNYPDKKERIPKNLDWDLFLGPAEELPYHSAFTPFGWRAWWNFGNGALGSTGPHMLEPIFRALKLSSPENVDCSSSYVSLESAPLAEKITFYFGRRDHLPKLAMPELKLTWYDGGLKPERPAGIPANIRLGSEDGGIVFIGSEGMLICEPYGVNYKVIKNGHLADVQVEKIVRRITDSLDNGHEMDWVRACKESAENRLQASADFDSQAALSETLLVGSMAVRLQSLQKNLIWNSNDMRFTNIGENEEFVIQKSGDFYIENGIPKINQETVSYNARHFVEKTVRPIYRSGWNQI